MLNENYPLNNSRNDVKPYIDDLINDSIEERYNRLVRKSSFNVTYQLNRKRFKTFKSKDQVLKVLLKRIIKNIIKVLKLNF
jgi:hypothetical protein